MFEQSSITRMPSYESLLELMKFHGSESVQIDVNKTFYVLDPVGDLPSTRESFEDKFRA